VYFHVEKVEVHYIMLMCACRYMQLFFQ